MFLHHYKNFLYTTKIIVARFSNCFCGTFFVRKASFVRFETQADDNIIIQYIKTPEQTGEKNPFEGTQCMNRMSDALVAWFAQA